MKTGIQSRRRGTSAVEFALVAPVMFLIVFGIFEFGRAIMVLDLLSNVSRQGARAGAIAGRSNANINSVIDSALTSTTLPARGSGTTITIAVNGSTAKDASTAVSDDQITVTVAVPVSAVSWIPTNFLAPETSLSRATTMRRE